MHSTLIALAAATAASLATAAGLGTTRHFTVHDVASAPEHSKPVIEGYLKDFGFSPNVVGVMAESPALLNAYAATQKAIHDHGTLTPAEINLVQLTASEAHGCNYCKAAHSMVALNMLGVEAKAVSRAASGQALSDPKQEALRSFTLAVLSTRGAISDSQWQAFTDAGYNRAQALEVIAGISVKMMSNSTNRLAGTPLDDAFAEFATSD